MPEADDQAPVSSLIFTALDLETTGLDPAQDAIIEIGGVKFCNNTVIEDFEQLVYTDHPLSQAVQQVHSITPEMLRGQPTIDQVAPRFLEFLGDTILMAHNAPFDMGFLNAMTHHLGLKRQRNRVINTLDIARRAFPGRANYRLEALALDLHLGYEPSSAHRSLHDAIICMRLFEKIIEELGFMGDITLSELLPD